MPIPSALEPLFLQFSLAFANPTFARWTTLLGAAILTRGRRTVSNLLRTVSAHAPGDASSYRRVFSERRWSLWPLSRALAEFIITRWVPEGPVFLAGDDTVSGHPGPKVYGKGRHRDPVRSTKSFMAYRWGHKWLVLCLLVRFPFAKRPWALPVLVVLYRTPAWSREHKRRHKTPVTLMRQMIKVLMRWCPERSFIFAGDGGFSPHALAALAQASGKRLTVVGKFHPGAGLYAPPPRKLKGQKGRPRKKGKQRPTPQEMVARRRRRQRQRMKVAWYGGKKRKVEIVTGTGGWYKSGRPLVPVRWVFVHDREGTHREEYFFSTDPRMTPRQIIEAYTGRWSIEVTFEEARAYLGLETTRGWSEKTVLRAEPCLIGLFSIVALMYAEWPARIQQAGRVLWPGKDTFTFSDAITAVRRHLWTEWILAGGVQDLPLSKLPRAFKEMLLYGLAPAA